MRIGSVQNFRPNNSVSFGNLTKEEKESFIKTKQAALDIIGRPDRSVFIYSSACLPQSAENNTGTGTLLSKQGDELLDVVKTFTTTNIMQDLPSGEFLPKPPKDFYSAYGGSSESLSTHLIDPEFLMKESLITPEELKIVVDANNGEKKAVLANFKNVVEPDSPFENVLKKAYERFVAGEGEEFDNLRKEFTEYNAKNADWLESHGIFDVLSKKYGTPTFDKWTDETDKRLYDPDFSPDLRTARKETILKENAKDIEFYNFKRFMADKCLELAREKTHDKGLLFGGDVPYQFSLADMFGNPKAFSYDVYMGPKIFKFPALNFYQITDPNSPAAKMLARKIRLAAERYDTLRMDLGWGYVTPMLSNSAGTYSEKKQMGSQLLNFIEKTVREVKGYGFDTKDIFYEVEAAAEDFRAFNDDNSVIEPLRDRMKIYSSDYMSEDWGSSRIYREKFHISPDDFIYGASNQDTTPLHELAASDAYTTRKASQVKELSNILKIEPSVLQNGDEFIRAKNAEPLLAKNHFMFFTEFFGMRGKFNSHDNNGAENFRLKMPANPEQAYYDAVKEGRAFNLMDGLEKAFVAKGFDKKYPDLFTKIVEFKEKLYGIRPSDKTAESAASTSSVIGEKPAIESAPLTTEPSVKDTVGEVIQDVAEEVKTTSQPQTESMPAEEAIKTVKKNKYAKPLIIVAVLLAAGFSVYKFFANKKAA